MKIKKYYFNNNNIIFIKYKVFIIILMASFNNLNYSENFNIYSEFYNLEKFLIICNNTKLINKEGIKRNNNPKVSIITTVFNREKYILRFINCIKSQNFKDIEIIFIDDCSKDKSVKVIEKYKEIDKRIILIKHKKNKGTFISRNIGIKISKGKYVILPDPDDILSRDIIKFCYNFLETYNYEMIRFNLYLGNRKIHFSYLVKKLKSRPIYQPELSTYLFYGRGYLIQIDYNVSNKFIKREAYIRALNSLDNFYLNIYMTIAEDGLINFILYKSVKSFYYIKKIGYYYIKNKQSISKSNFKTKQLQLFLKFIFLNIKILFEFSKNNKYEKDMVNSYFFNRFNKRKKIINNFKPYLNKDYKFYNKIINMLLKCQYINKRNKNILNKFKYLMYNKL